MRKGKDFPGIGVGVIIHNGGKILLMRRGPEARNEHGLWDLPGGGVRFGERRAQTAVRETYEEVGLIVEVRYVLHGVDHLIPDENDRNKIVEHWTSTPFICVMNPRDQTPVIREPGKCLEIGWFKTDGPGTLPSDLTIATELSIREYWSGNWRAVLES